jgi:hypothetical protein
MRNPSATTLALLALTGTLTAGAILAQKAPPAPAAVAPAGPIHISLPFNKAIVRESVPIRLHEFPQGGYVAVSIDGRFVTAQALPNSPREPVFVWDTKAGYAPADAPDTLRTYNDGLHALTIVVYDKRSQMVGNDTVSVQLSNRINLPASQGITLTYPWKTSRDLRYQRRTALTAASTDAPPLGSPPPIQESRLRFARSVENATGGEYLVRDEIIPVDRSARSKPFVSYVATRGSVVPLSQVRALYRTVDARGRVLSDLPSENRANSIGFSIPVLPPRRVSVGAHWQSPVKLTLDWTSPTPATVTATSTLEGFEWQDRYPTAKIRETYAGPALFRPAPGSPLPPLAAQDIKFERVIYFAYNAGRIVRMQTTLSLTTNTPGLVSLGAFGAAAGGYPGGGGGGYPGGGFGGGYPGGGGGGYPGGGGGGYPGGGGGGYPGGGGGGYPGGFGGGGYPGGGGGGYPGGGFGGGGFPSGGFGGGAGNPNAPTKLVYTEINVVI